MVGSRLAMHRIIDTKLFYISNDTGNEFTNYKWLREPTLDYRQREPTLVDATNVKKFLTKFRFNFLPDHRQPVSTAHFSGLAPQNRAVLKRS